MIFCQRVKYTKTTKLFDSVSSTYTYLLADLTTKECVLIDPVQEHAKRDAQLVTELGFQLKYASKCLQIDYFKCDIWEISL